MNMIRLLGIVSVLLLCISTVGNAENKLRQNTSKKLQFLSISEAPDKRSVIGVLRPTTGKAEDATLVVKTAKKTFPLLPIGSPISDMTLLFECVAKQAMGPSYECRDFGSSVTWSSDSKWFIIDGGAHKFWSLAAYRLQSTGPDLLQLPSDDEMATAARKPGNLPRQKIVVSEDEPFVVTQGQGVFGVHSHPYTCCDEDEDIHVYIIIDFRGAEVGRIIAIGEIGEGKLGIKPNDIKQ